MIGKAIDYLRAQQDQATGGWAVNPKGPNATSRNVVGSSSSSTSVCCASAMAIHL